MSVAIMSGSSADGDGIVDDGAGMFPHTIRQFGETGGLARPYVVRSDLIVSTIGSTTYIQEAFCILLH